MKLLLIGAVFLKLILHLILVHFLRTSRTIIDRKSPIT